MKHEFQLGDTVWKWTDVGLQNGIVVNKKYWWKNWVSYTIEFAGGIQKRMGEFRLFASEHEALESRKHFSATRAKGAVRGGEE